MMKPGEVITSVEQVTVGWLTAVLTRSHALTSGTVTEFTVLSGEGNWSSNARLSLTYSIDAVGPRPTQLLLKMVNTDTGDGEYFLPDEVTYYTRDYVDVPDAPLVGCYDAAYDAHQQRYHLLLDDLTDTHEPAYDLTPTLAHGLAVADGLAILHAHWWGTNRLESIDAPFHDTAHIQRFFHISAPGILHVKTIFADQLEPHWPEQIDHIFARLPEALAARTQHRQHLTKIHGDPNPGNLLLPKVGTRPLFFIDQQPFDWSFTTWLGVYDLAYLMGLYWPVEQRRGLETAVLQRYLTTLHARGVTGYSWEQLWDDYRLSIALTVVVAVEYMRDGGDPDWNGFRAGLVQRTLTASDDLEIFQRLIA